MNPLRLLLLLSVALFLGCSADTPEKAPLTQEPRTNLPEVKKEIPDNRPPLYLDGLYATSTDPSSDVRNAFDKDEATLWKTIPGAGPDEGIMLYFSTDVHIKSIQVEGVNSSDLATIEKVMIYGNGAPLSEVPEGQIAEINQGFGMCTYGFLQKKISKPPRTILKMNFIQPLNYSVLIAIKGLA